MGIYDNIDNKVKNLRSKRDETVKVDSIRSEMQKINDVIREQIQHIGQFYWQKYYNGDYAPCEDKIYFDRIDRCNEEMKYLINKIEDCKVDGLTERETIDYVTNVRIEQRRIEAEARRIQRAEEKERRRIENAEKRRLLKEERDRQTAITAAEYAHLNEEETENVYTESVVESSDDNGHTKD